VARESIKPVFNSITQAVCDQGTTALKTWMSKLRKVIEAMERDAQTIEDTMKQSFFDDAIIPR